MLYVPILKDKAGELKSMTLLSQPTAINLDPLWPLIEVRSPEEETGIASSLDKVLRELEASPCQRFMIDLTLVDADYPGATLGTPPAHPLAYISNESAGKWSLTPVLTLWSSSTLLTEAVAAATHHRSGIALRLSFDDINDPAFPTNLDSLVVASGMRRSDIHIILDAAAVSDSQLSAMQMALNGVLTSFPHVSAWATITIASSAFPTMLPFKAADRAGAIARSPRTEWELFKRLHARFPALGLNFGDYVIENPDFTPNPNARAVSNLRYTTDAEWLFVKGKLLKDDGARYFRTVCTVLSAQLEYRGPTYSWGDQFVDVCGGGGGGTGNATTWRQVAITHHITLVLEQLGHFASSAGGSATPPGASSAP